MPSLSGFGDGRARELAGALSNQSFSRRCRCEQVTRFADASQDASLSFGPKMQDTTSLNSSIPVGDCFETGRNVERNDFSHKRLPASSCSLMARIGKILTRSCDPVAKTT